MQDIRICFIGDSFINGTGDETALGWAGRLCVAANNRMQVTYYNLGIRRDTSWDSLQRWKQECTIRLPEHCDGGIVLSCGVNDTVIESGQLRVQPDESCANISKILHGAKKYKVLMVGSPPLGEDNQDSRIQNLSFAFAQESKRFGVPYIDLFAPLSGDEAYKQEVLNNDGAHPKSSGYAKMASIIAASPVWWFHDNKQKF